MRVDPQRSLARRLVLVAMAVAVGDVGRAAADPLALRAVWSVASVAEPAGGGVAIEQVWTELRSATASWPSAGRALAAGERAALERWLALPLVERETWIEQLARPACEEADQRTALRVLSEASPPDRVVTFCAIGELAIEGAAARAEDWIEQATHAWVERDVGLYTFLPARLGKATPELRCAMYAGIAQSGTPRALEFLADRLGFSPEEDRVLLNFVGTRVGSAVAELPERLLSRAREALASSNAGLRREAALALGRLESPEAATYLAPLLDSAVASDRDAAAWALGRITGLRLQPRAEVWNRWLAVEQEYWNERGEALLSGLERMNRKQQAEALRELAQHPFQRLEIARSVAPLLRCDDPKVERMSICVLADLGGAAALAALSSAAAERSESDSDLLQAAIRRLDPEQAVPHKRKKTVGDRNSSSPPTPSR